MQYSSPLVVMAVTVYQQFRIRFLVDVLNKLGFCSSYIKAQNYGCCVVFHQGTDFVTHISFCLKGSIDVCRDLCFIQTLQQDHYELDLSIS